jgi:hypothetical protein
LPRLDNGAITAANPPTAARAELWMRQHIHVRGRPDWVFVKVHTHGATPENAGLFLGPGGRGLHEALRQIGNDGDRWRLHYVSAREMFNLVRAAEDGVEGDPGAYRDYEIGPPPVCRAPA